MHLVPMAHKHSRFARLGLATAIGLLVLAPSLARAQTVDPTRVEFVPSVDHYATNPDGTPVVQYYRLDLYLVGAIQPFTSVSLLKRAPDPDGIIRQDLTTVLVGWPIAGTIYNADVAAVGPAGDARSALSNTFSFSTTQCSATATPETQAIGADGSSVSTSVTAGSGCPWNATSNVNWITVTAGSTGIGNGNVTYAVAANTSETSTTARTGTLTVAGRTVTVTRSGAEGGVVMSLAVDRVAPTILYAGTTGGGVFMTMDRGVTWSAINTGLSNTEMQAIAIDPITTTTLYGGTNGGGVFTSADGGGSWSAVNTGLTTTTVLALAIDPVTPTTVYAGTMGSALCRA